MAEPEFILDGDVLKSVKNCEGKIEIPDGVKYIFYRAFYCCEKVTEIVLPNGVAVIDEYAFSGCKALARIFIPRSVTKIYNGAFFGCPNLTVYCEAAPTEDWIDKKEEHTRYVESEEDYAFNFHRSSGSWNTHAVTETKHYCWNPLSRPVITNISREEYSKIK